MTESILRQSREAESALADALVSFVITRIFACPLIRLLVVLFAPKGLENVNSSWDWSL